MSNFSSNCPVSRPIKQTSKADADFGGMSWSNEHGLFYVVEDELLPMIPPNSQRQ